MIRINKPYFYSIACVDYVKPIHIQMSLHTVGFTCGVIPVQYFVLELILNSSEVSVQCCLTEVSRTYGIQINLCHLCFLIRVLLLRTNRTAHHRNPDRYFPSTHSSSGLQRL